MTYWNCGRQLQKEQIDNEIYFQGTTVRDFDMKIIIYFYKETNIDPVTVKHRVSLAQELN